MNHTPAAPTTPTALPGEPPAARPRVVSERTKAAELAMRRRIETPSTFATRRADRRRRGADASTGPQLVFIGTDERVMQAGTNGPMVSVPIRLYVDRLDTSKRYAAWPDEQPQPLFESKVRDRVLAIYPAIPATSKPAGGHEPSGVADSVRRIE